MDLKEGKHPAGLLGVLCLTLALIAHGTGADRWCGYLLVTGMLSLGVAAAFYWLERDTHRHARATGGVDR
ncbi:hypothetical protein ABZ419_27220 [Streptomyces cinnamoneus]|uniref:hypothetical protein n=1 Tax=Streptomyces cinnamoneus TaxID=53446 RepID=UPI0033EE4B7E